MSRPSTLPSAGPNAREGPSANFSAKLRPSGCARRPVPRHPLPRSSPASHVSARCRRRELPTIARAAGIASTMRAGALRRKAPCHERRRGRREAAAVDLDHAAADQSAIRCCSGRPGRDRDVVASRARDAATCRRACRSSCGRAAVGPAVLDAVLEVVDARRRRARAPGGRRRAAPARPRATRTRSRPRSASSS